MNRIPLDEYVLVRAVQHTLASDAKDTPLLERDIRDSWPYLSYAAQGAIASAISDAVERGVETFKPFVRHILIGLADAIDGDTIGRAPGHDEEPLNDFDGYPSEKELRHLASFRGTPRELIDYAISLWRGGAGTELEEVTDEFGIPGYRATFVTGGWSGCESVISVLNQTLARSFSESWSRGGKHTYFSRKQMFEGAEPWDWSFPTASPFTLHAVDLLRDRVADLERQLSESNAQ